MALAAEPQPLRSNLNEATQLLAEGDSNQDATMTPNVNVTDIKLNVKSLQNHKTQLNALGPFTVVLEMFQMGIY